MPEQSRGKPLVIIRFYCAAAMVFIIVGCGGRAAHPVAFETALDPQLSCSHLRGEYANNEKRLAELKGERKESNANNAGLLVANPLFLDLKGSLEKEAAAIEARNERLKALMTEKACDAK